MCRLSHPAIEMLAADAYRPDEWRDFFLMVGGAAAALTGLVFVALSLNLDVVVRDATHRYRAIGTMTNFAGIFVLCALALMGGQNHGSSFRPGRERCMSAATYGLARPAEVERH